MKKKFKNKNVSGHIIHAHSMNKPQHKVRCPECGQLVTILIDEKTEQNDLRDYIPVTSFMPDLKEYKKELIKKQEYTTMDCPTCKTVTKCIKETTDGRIRTLCRVCDTIIIKYTGENPPTFTTSLDDD